MPELKVENFDKGMTDHWVDGPQNAAKNMENLWVNNNGKLVQRPGMEYHDPDDKKIPYIGDANYINSFMRNAFYERYLAIGSDLHQKTSIAGWSRAYNSDAGVLGHIGLGSGKTSVVNIKDHIFAANGGLPQKIFRGGVDGITFCNAGLPAVDLSSLVVTLGGTGTSVSYILYFCWYRYYQSGTSVYEDFGPVSQYLYQDASKAVISGGNTMGISGIPNLDTTFGREYIVDEHVSPQGPLRHTGLAIFRTTNGGSIPYAADDDLKTFYEWDDTTGALSKTDAEIQDYRILYINSGEPDNDEPWKTSYLISAKNCIWYLLGNRIRQSKPGDWDSVPGSYYTDLDEDITGGSQIQDSPIVFTHKQGFRIEGVIDSLGRGFHTVKTISYSVGCISNASIVPVKKSLYFASAGGFYRTDGYNVQRLSKYWNETYKTFTDTDDKIALMEGHYDDVNNLVVWAVQIDGSDTRADTFVVLNLNKPIVDEQGCFTIWTGIQPDAFFFEDGELVFSQQPDRGSGPVGDPYLMRLDADQPSDYNINKLGTLAGETRKAIIYDYASCALSFGTTLFKKWITKFVGIFFNETDLTVTPSCANDATETFQEMKEIRFRDHATNDKMIMSKRHVPRQGLRCVFKQFRLTNSYTIVERSDDHDTVTINDSLKTAQLASGTWPSDMIGHYLSFDDDGYTNEFEITRQSGDTLTMADPGGDLTSASGIKWLIKGNPKDEQFKLSGYVVPYNYFGESHKAFSAGDEGGNA